MALISFLLSMCGWCLQGLSVMSLAPSSPRFLIMWPGWESEGDATCYCGQIGWWLEACCLELWSSSVYVLHCWLVQTQTLAAHYALNITCLSIIHINNSISHSDPVSWIRMAREGANQTTVSLVAVGLPHGRLLIKRFKGDLTQEDSQKPASQNDTRLHSTRCYIVAVTTQLNKDQ